MCRRETLEMLVSSSSMNVAIVTVRAMAHNLRAAIFAGAAAISVLPADRCSASAAILWARPTFPDASDALDPGPGRTRFAPAGAAPPSRSFRWRSPLQKAESFAAGARQVPDVAPIVASEGINVDAHSLATMHPRELGFLEVRGK